MIRDLHIRAGVQSEAPSVPGGMHHRRVTEPAVICNVSVLIRKQQRNVGNTADVQIPVIIGEKAQLPFPRLHAGKPDQIFWPDTYGELFLEGVLQCEACLHEGATVGGHFGGYRHSDIFGIALQQIGKRLARHPDGRIRTELERNACARVAYCEPEIKHLRPEFKPSGLLFRLLEGIYKLINIDVFVSVLTLYKQIIIGQRTGIQRKTEISRTDAQVKILTGRKSGVILHPCVV